MGCLTLLAAKATRSIGPFLVSSSPSRAFREQDENPAAAHPDHGLPRAAMRDCLRRVVGGRARRDPAAAHAAGSDAGATASAATAAAAATAASAAAAASAPSASASATTSSAAGLPLTPTDPWGDASGLVHRTQWRNDWRWHERRDLIARRVVGQFHGQHLRPRGRPGTTACKCRPRGLFACLDLALWAPQPEADDPEIRTLKGRSRRVRGHPGRTGLPAGGPLSGQGPRRHEPRALPGTHQRTTAAPRHLCHSRPNTSRPQGADGDEARDLQAEATPRGAGRCSGVEHVQRLGW